MMKMIWFGFVAVLLALVAGGIWTALLVVNLRTSASFPWSVVVMGLLLWAAWQYLSGAWGHGTGAENRRRLMRANVVPREPFLLALTAGLSSVVSLAGLWILLAELTRIPGNRLPSFRSYPWFTTAAVLVMASLVSSIAEEIAIRGYLQSMLEKRTNATLAILIAVLAFAPGHAITQRFVWQTILFYLLADAMFGCLAYFTNSIVPGIVVHSVGLLIFFTLIWPFDATRRIVLQAGPDFWFWAHTAQFVIFAVISVFALHRLSRMGKHLRPAPTFSLRDDTPRDARSGA